MGKPKVLHINTLDTQGGASQVAIDLITHLDADCHLVTLKRYSGNPKVIKLKKNFIDWFFFFIDKVNWRLGLRTPIRTLLSFDNEYNYTYQKLIKLREYREAKIIHLHNIHGGFFDFETLQKIAAEKKIVWTLHDMWAITGGEAHTFENENYKKGIGETPYINIYPLLNPLFDRRQVFLEKKKKIYEEIWRSIVIVPVSYWLKNNFEQAFVYNPNLRLSVIHNGIDTDVFSNKKERTWQKPRLLFFNLANPFKGSKVFTDIINQISVDFDLYIVGDPLETKPAAYIVNYIESREVLNELYNQVDFLIFPSLAENFPLTILEAMACGVCVISSNVGGIPEMLDETLGYLFDPKNQEDCLDKVNAALSNLDSSRAKGLLSEKHVLKNYTLNIACNEYIKLYREIFKYKHWNYFNQYDMLEKRTVQKEKFFQPSMKADRVVVDKINTNANFRLTTLQKEMEKKITNCLVCNSSNLRPLDLEKKPWLVKCMNCNFVFSQWAPSEAELIDYYQDYTDYDYVNQITLNRYNEWINGFESVRKTNRILDVGCGDGHLLEQAKKKNWDVFGTEYSDKWVERCEKKGINMHKGKLDPAFYEPESFDVISYVEVIEHINNPIEEIKKAASLLRRGGIIFLTTPNFNALSRRVLGLNWNMICYPEHLSYYSPSTITKLFTENGFKKIAVKTKGISPGRLMSSWRTKGNEDINSTDAIRGTDQELRKRIESSSGLKILKRSINHVLTTSQLGDSMHAWFEKL